MKLIIEDDEGRKTVVQLVREEITIGRQEGNFIRLTERNVSRRHARLVRNNGSILIEDLGSYNGVRVNGEKIQGPTRIKEGDLVEIGDYDLGIEGKLEPITAPAPGVGRQPTVPPQMVRPPQKQPTMPAITPVPQMAPPQATNAPADAGATAIIRVSDLTAQAPAVEGRELDRSEMPRLVGLSGPVRGKELYLMRTDNKFGRTDDNDIVVDHQSVSRSHARFVLDGLQWKVIDNKSANGVRVNGDEYAISGLKAGDVVELGHLKFRFCAPGEKYTAPRENGEDTPARGGLKPTTAELIAGAQGRGSAAAKRGSPAALISAISGAVIAAAAIAYFVVARSAAKQNAEPAGAEAVRQGDSLFKLHRYRDALDKYELAGDVPAPNKKKAAEEARGEEAYTSLKQAVDAHDAEKARSLFDRCAGESTYWCQRAAEMKDQVAAVWSRKHLDAASEMKMAGKLDACRAEIGSVLAFDPANAEAQSLQPQCAAPARAVVTAEPKAPPEKREAPSAKEREVKAARLARTADEKLNARDFQSAMKDANAALAQSPSDKTVQSSAWRTLGYANAYLGDIPAAKKYLKLYKPFCGSDCAQVEAFLAR